MTATLPGAPPVDLHRKIDEVFDQKFFAKRSAGLRPHVEFVEKLPDGGGVYEVSVTGEDFGGPRSERVRLTSDQWVRPADVKFALNVAYLDILHAVEDHLAAERNAENLEA